MASLNSSDTAFVRTLLRERAAIQIAEDKDYLIETRLAGAAQSHAVSGGITELVAKARSGDPASGTTIIEALTTHETYFFRDVIPFQVLERDVLPPLLERRAARRSLTIWSAACSSGQEPYSIAMMLHERFPQLVTWNLRIIATDISGAVLERARAATYKQLEINRGLPAALLPKYFTKAGVQWRVVDSIRHSVEFHRLNLLDSWSVIPQVDVVLMRNVLIYFDNATKGRLLSRVRSTIAPDGALFLGAAETTAGLCDGWVTAGSGEHTFHKVKP